MSFYIIIHQGYHFLPLQKILSCLLCLHASIESKQNTRSPLLLLSVQPDHNVPISYLPNSTWTCSQLRHPPSKTITLLLFPFISSFSFCLQYVSHLLFPGTSSFQPLQSIQCQQQKNHIQLTFIIIYAYFLSNTINFCLHFP